MKKKSIKSLSFQKSNVATISGGLQNAQAHQQYQAITDLVGCPDPNGTKDTACISKFCR